MAKGTVAVKGLLVKNYCSIRSDTNCARVIVAPFASGRIPASDLVISDERIKQGLRVTWLLVCSLNNSRALRILQCLLYFIIYIVGNGASSSVSIATASTAFSTATKAIYVLVAIILGSDVANCPIDY